MANSQFINLEELSKTTQALLSKINEQSNLKVNKNNVRQIVTSGTKIAEIENTEIYAPEIDTSNLITQDDLMNFSDGLATVATSGSYNDLSNKPDTSTFMVKGTDYVTAGQKSGTTLGSNATAEGANTIASGTSAHAEGNYTTASGSHSHSEGEYTTAQRKSQHVFGEYNILDEQGTSTGARGKYVEIVGNGSSNARSNARTLDWSGNEVLAGKLTIGTAPTEDMDVTTKQYVDNKITSLGNIPIAETDANVETMLDSFNLDYTSNSSSPNMWTGGSY